MHDEQADGKNTKKFSTGNHNLEKIYDFQTNVETIKYLPAILSDSDNYAALATANVEFFR